MTNFDSGEVNIKEVAKRAGVSIATVSLALNGKGRISDKTRDRIKQIAVELGYVSNRQAASFRTGKSRTLGFVVQSRKSPASLMTWRAEIGQMLYDIVHAAAKHNYAVTAIPQGDADSLKQFGIAGLILSDSTKDDFDYLTATKLGIPVGTNERPDLTNLAVNLNLGYQEMTNAAFDLLLARGSKLPALLTEPNDLYSNYQVEIAYTQWCEKHSIKPLVANGKYDKSNLVQQVNFLIDAGADAIYSFHEHGPEIQKILIQRDLRVPQDVMLIAAIPYKDDENKNSGVTSTVYHFDKNLDKFVDALIDVIEGRSAPGITINVPWELNEYQSTRR
jgi:DNA-binding LacI/PurR family transcriptional regulator